MLKLDRTTRRLRPVARRSLGEAGLRERSDLQALIRGSAKEFFAEIGEDLLIVGEEIRPSESVADRIDLLAIAPDGASVVIELKRGSHRMHLLQAASYAGMVQRWPSERFAEELATGRNLAPAEAQAKIEDYLEDAVGSLNRRQRLVLVAEGFDAALLAAAEWLHEKHRVDLLLVRVEFFVEGENEYIAFNRVFPAPRTEPAERPRAETGPADWDEALLNIRNPFLADFIRSELRLPGRNSSPERRSIRYWRGGRRLFWMAIKPDFATVGQSGRFEGDVTFWRERLSMPDRVRPRIHDREVGFRLVTAEDFARFKSAFENDLRDIQFRYGPEDEHEDEDDAVSEPEAG